MRVKLKDIPTDTTRVANPQAFGQIYPQRRSLISRMDTAAAIPFCAFPFKLIAKKRLVGALGIGANVIADTISRFR
jgi:hypothetical protein